jgi:RNA polymerase sigma-70 factor (ECF subfamily)
MHSMGVDRSEDATLDALRRRFLGNGDEAAMEDLVRLTRPRLLGAARRIGHPQDAEDSVQSAYHALLQRGAAEIEGPVVAWLLTAVVRIAYRRKAEARRRDDIARRLAPRNPAPDPASLLGGEEEARVLRGLVERLPPKYRDALVLHHLQGLDVADVAALLDAPESTVKARLRRGRAVLRSRIPPVLHLALLSVPGAVADSWHGLVSRTPSALGGAMQAKTAATVLAAALLLVGGASWALLDSPAAPGPARGPAEGPDPGGDAATAPAASAAASGPATGAEPAADGPAAVVAADHPAWKEEIPASVLKAAAGLPDAALKAAWDAFQSGKRNVKKGPYRIVEPEALDALKSQGADGFRAVAALLRGGAEGTWFRDLVQASWSPGLEGLLFEVADDASLSPNPRWCALDSLSQADCAASRDYLVARAAREADASLLMGVVRSLAYLREPRAAEAIATKIEEKVHGPIFRRTMMSCLAEMDPAVARRVLLDRLRSPDADLLESTVRSLDRVDPAAAKAEAAAILGGPRAEGLTPAELRGLRQIANRPN